MLVTTIGVNIDGFYRWEEFLDTTDIFYNGSNIGILEVVVRIYAGLARYDNLRSIAMRKLFQFLFHRYPKVYLPSFPAILLFTCHRSGLRLPPHCTSLNRMIN